MTLALDKKAGPGGGLPDAEDAKVSQRTQKEQLDHMLAMPIRTGDHTLQQLGASLREHREALRVSGTTVAEEAKVCRATVRRIERGEASVSAGAYARVAAALGLLIRIGDEPFPPSLPPMEDVERGAVRLADCAQLKQLAWNLPSTAMLTPHEAFGLYERNWRHLDPEQFEPVERALLDRLIRTVGNGHLLV